MVQKQKSGEDAIFSAFELHFRAKLLLEMECHRQRSCQLLAWHQ